MSFWVKEDKESRETVKRALEREGHETVKRLGELLAVKPKSRRKADFVEAILPHLEDNKLSETLSRLNETQKKAVAEAVYHPKNEFDDGRFKAKYGVSADFGKPREVFEEPTATFLHLFIYRDEISRFIPADLSEKLKKFVAPPPDLAIKAHTRLPEKFTLREANFNWSTKREEIKIKEIPLTVAATETAARRDVNAVLRLVEAGKIAASDKTFQPSAASVQEITSVLQGGDFYELPDKNKKRSGYFQEIGAIKGFAWPILLQAAKLVELTASKKLKISDEGRKFLLKSPPEILRHIWQKWLKTTLFDELRRIDSIKGQTGKGKNTLTGIKPRREAVNEALKNCATGEWLAIDEFLRVLRVNHDFSVSRNLWELYVEEPGYGSLGYDFGRGLDKWLIVEGRYALSVLFEYAATLGLIDVAYIPPFGARRDFKDLWGVDDYDFFSRYDGLMFLRLNNLGAFCLGLTDAYEPPAVTVKSSLRVLPDLTIKVTGEPLAADEKLFLAGFAESESPEEWRLSRDLTISALENGQTIESLREFLQKREEQELPDPVEGFLRETTRRASALRDQGLARIIECETAEIARQIVVDARAQKLCFRASEKSLGVWAETEKQFREIVRKIGYGLK